MIAIEAIKFNHNSNSATHDAFNIRKNATQFVHVPEWRRFISVNPEDSPAAYAVGPTHGHTITIEVAIVTSDPGASFMEVRVENHVKARSVNFTNGKTGFVTFELINPPVSHGRVGIWDLNWHWEYRLGPHHPWHYFDTTRHRIYVVLDVPEKPWQQMPYNPGNQQLPWTDVLNYACRWADGAASRDMAAALVTQMSTLWAPPSSPTIVLAGAAPTTAGAALTAPPSLDRLHGGLATASMSIAVIAPRSFPHSRTP